MKLISYGHMKFKDDSVPLRRLKIQYQEFLSRDRLFVSH